MWNWSTPKQSFCIKNNKVLNNSYIIEETRKLNLAKTERQNSELDANLKLLSQQSEAAAAAAEVDALE